MSLFDVIKAVHSCDNFDVNLLINKKARQYEKRLPPREDGWHPSSFVGMCSRRHVIEKLCDGFTNPDVDTKTLRIFHVGTAVHNWYQNNYFSDDLWGKWKCIRCDAIKFGLYPKGTCYSKNHIWKYEEVPIRAPALPNVDKDIVGHSDGIVNMFGSWYLLEIKTMKQEMFNYMKAPPKKNVRQANLYYHFIKNGFVDFGDFDRGDVPELKGIVIIYINKNDSSEKVYFIDYDEKLAESDVNRVRQVEQSFIDKRFPRRRSKCKNMLTKPAEDCPVVSICFGKKEWI